MSETPSILIVDSNMGFAMMLKQSLEEDNHYRATIAGAADEALAKASKQPFDLAIVDLGIEPVRGLDGQAVARKLREEQVNLRLMLIPLEGEALAEEAPALDVQGVLPKPFFLPDLPDLVQGALSMPLTGIAEPAETARPAQEETTPAVKPPKPSAATRRGSRKIVRELESLAQGVNAAAVVLTRREKLLGSVGHLSAEELDAIAGIVSESCQISRRAARVLGRAQEHFEISMAGDEHTLYSLTVVGDVLVSVVMRSHVAVGFIRHRVKQTLDRLHQLLADR